jgi:hypothetical protein
MPKAWQKVRPNEAIARAINAEPWEPLPGMVKRARPAIRGRLTPQQAPPAGDGAHTFPDLLVVGDARKQPPM